MAVTYTIQGRLDGLNTFMQTGPIPTKVPDAKKTIKKFARHTYHNG